MTRRLGPLPHDAAAALSLMHDACFPEEPWDAAAFQNILPLPGVFGYLAWQDGAPAGFILGRDLGEEAEILTFGVLPEMRRLGIGRALLREVIARLAGLRIGALVLEVAVDNEPARRLYESIGFAQIGRRPRYYDRGQYSADAMILQFGIPRSGAEDDARR